jgi:hypothetical protein
MSIQVYMSKILDNVPAEFADVGRYNTMSVWMKKVIDLMTTEKNVSKKKQIRTIALISIQRPDTRLGVYVLDLLDDIDASKKMKDKMIAEAKTRVKKTWKQMYDYENMIDSFGRRGSSCV